MSFTSYFSRWASTAALMSAPVLISALMPSITPLAAQSTKPIGLINGGTVLLESKSVKREAGIITAALRVQFHKPTKVPGGNWYSSRTMLMLDCRKQVVAVKENWYYSDAKGTKVAQHKEVGIPGYATPLPGSMPKVALDHLCKG